MASTTLVSVFPDRSATQQAVDRLVRDGIPAARIRLHRHAATARNAALIGADEYLSGGFFSNLTALFDALLDHHVAQGDASTYADVVRSEGTLVSVECHDPAEERRFEALLRAAGALQVSLLPAHDTVSFHRLHPELPDGA
jgi:hypothetical protein